MTERDFANQHEKNTCSRDLRANESGRRELGYSELMIRIDLVQRMSLQGHYVLPSTVPSRVIPTEVNILEIQVKATFHLFRHSGEIPLRTSYLSSYVWRF